MSAHREYSIEDRILLAERGLTVPWIEPDALLWLGEVVDIIEDDLYEDCLEHTPEADRVRALQDEITRHWRTNTMRETTERQLLEETPEECPLVDAGGTVVFTTNRLTRDRALRSVIEAHRVDTTRNSGRRIRPIVVLRASRQVWHVMRVHQDEWSPYATRHVVGPAVDCPGEEALETALALWDPDDTGSPYHEIEDAVTAAIRICSRDS